MSDRRVTVPRSLQVVSALGMGGAETWLMEVLRLWARTGEAKMEFLITSGNHGIFDEEAKSLGAHLHYLPFGRQSLPAFTRGFRRILRDGAYHAIHDHQDYVSGWHFALAGSNRPPICVTHVHNPSYQILNNYGVSWLRRSTSRVGRALVRRCATHIAGTSGQILKEYGFDAPSFEGLPMAALYCGFDPSRFNGDPGLARKVLLNELGWPTSTKIVLFAGRVDHSSDPLDRHTHKNSGFAVEVVLRAARKDPRVRLLVAGKESASVPELEARANSLGLGEHVRFLGVRSDIAHLMLGSDLLLFPSRGEGLGMVAVEAQAAGLPVLMSTAVPEESVVLPELVSRKALADGTKAWATDLLRLLGSPPGTSQAEAQRRIADSPFALRNSAAALRALYAEGRLTHACGKTGAADEN